MNPIASTGASINAVNDILQQSSKAMIDQAAKMMQVAVEMSVGKEAGKGQNIDVCA